MYLGWKWTGTLADEWYIDDIEVRALGPDIEVSITPQVDPLLVGAPVPAIVEIINHTNAPATNVALDFVFQREGRATMVHRLSSNHWGLWSRPS